MSQIRMKVGGMEYAINSDDDEAYVRELGAKLDRRLSELSRKNTFLSTTMVAVLAALEAYDEAGKKSREIEELRLEIKRLLEENAMSKMTAAAANRRLQELLGESEEQPEESPSKDAEYIKLEDENTDDDEFFEEAEYTSFEEDESGQYEIF